MRLMFYSFMLNFAMMRTNFAFQVNENTDFPLRAKGSAL